MGQLFLISTFLILIQLVISILDSRHLHQKHKPHRFHRWGFCFSRVAGIELLARVDAMDGVMSEMPGAFSDPIPATSTNK